MVAINAFDLMDLNIADYCAIVNLKKKNRDSFLETKTRTQFAD